MSATTRYRLWWIALVSVLALPAIALLQASGGAVAPASEPGTVTAPVIGVEVPPLPTWPAVVLAVMWSGWIAIALGRTAIALACLRRAARACGTFPAGREARLHHWTAIRQQGRRARLGVSDDVRLAAVLGVGRPAIAVAPEVLREMSDEDLDRILVHEWAHVQRRDDVGRLLQAIVRAVAGLHPAIWWIDRQLHLEREVACDDWTINMTGAAREYAACLTRLAALDINRATARLAPAVLSSVALKTRIVRILDRRRSTSTGASLPALATAASALVGLSLVAASVELVVIAAPLDTLQAAAVPVLRRIIPAPEAGASDLGQPRSVGPGVSARSRRAADPTRTPAPTAQPIGAMHEASVPEAVGIALEIRRDAEPPADLPHATDSTLDSLNALPGQALPLSSSSPAPVVNAKSPTPWSAAADTGVAVGRGSQKAAVATSRFFTKFAKSVAGAF
jgi:beta-lactamase regulating signal transducer with metallopeptidase domain